MSQLAVIAGYGTGISAAVAKRFGAAGYQLALLARTQSRLDASAKEFLESGVTAKGYSVDLGDPEAVKRVIKNIQQELGPIHLLFWNALDPSTRAPFQTATVEQDLQAYRVAVTGLMTAAQGALEDLKATRGAILVTGGALSLDQDAAIQMAIDWDASTLATSKAAQHKLVSIMNRALAADGVYVAEVTVTNAVRGTAFDPAGSSPLTAEAVAEEFWDVLQKRDPKVWFVVKHE